MKFDEINSIPELKKKEIRSVGEAIDVKSIVKNSFDKAKKGKSERLRKFLKNNNLDIKKIENDPHLVGEFEKLFTMLDKKEEEEIQMLRDKNSVLQKQLDTSDAIKQNREDLAKRIANKAGIEDQNEIDKISNSLLDISDKYKKSHELG